MFVSSTTIVDWWQLSTAVSEKEPKPTAATEFLIFQQEPTAASEFFIFQQVKLGNPSAIICVAW